MNRRLFQRDGNGDRFWCQAFSVGTGLVADGAVQGRRRQSFRVEALNKGHRVMIDKGLGAKVAVGVALQFAPFIGRSQEGYERVALKRDFCRCSNPRWRLLLAEDMPVIGDGGGQVDLPSGGCLFCHLIPLYELRLAARREEEQGI